MWEGDAQRMANASISHVRISEFDWALLEPRDGHYDWSLLDKSIDVLGAHGLKVILATPTAAPPSESNAAAEPTSLKDGPPPLLTF